MEPYSSSSSSSLLSFSVEKRKTNNTPKHYNSSLHSVRKTSPPAKITKKPIAPLPPIPPRVYLIDPCNFKELVQQLTAAPEFQNPSRMHKLAPPPVDIVPNFDQMSNSFMNVRQPAKNVSPSAGWFGNLFSPPPPLPSSSNGWFSSFPVLSPGTISSFEWN